jgi:DinB superfamily
MTTAQTIAKDLQALADALLDDIANVLAEFSDEALNTTPKGLQNNPFTIIYHLLGSASYWIGEVVGGLETGRVHPEEFNRTGTKAALLERLEDTKKRIHHALSRLTEKDLQDHPIDLSKGVLSWGELPPQGRTSVWVIAHDLSHLAYHLGQLKLLAKMSKAL